MKPQTTIRLLALALCSVVIGVLAYAPGASAHIGSSHAPYTTDGPDPRTATITSGSDARLCFDEQVLSPLTIIGGAPDIAARGYDSNIYAEAESADVDITNTSCLLVEFEHPNLDQATIVTIDGGKVCDVFGNCNLPGGLELTGSTFNAREAPVPGNTDAPEHILTTPIPQDDDIDYSFDEELDEDADSPDDCDPTAFGYHEQDGDRIDGTGGTCTVDGSIVTVDFTGVTDIQSGNVVRPFVETNIDSEGCDDPAQSVGQVAVYDLGTSDDAGDNNDEAKYPTGSGGLGNNTNDVDLLSITRQGNDQLVFNFDATNITDEDEACFYAHSEDGSIYVADSVSRAGAAVTATFLEVSQAFQQIVRAGVAPGGVDQVGGNPNTYGSSALSASGTEASAAEIPASMKIGYSDGTDLEQAITNDASNTINYCHDEPLHEDPTMTDPTQAFFTTADSADINYGDTVLTINGACALIQFDGADDVSTAVTAGLDILTPPDVIVTRDRLGMCSVRNEVNVISTEDCEDDVHNRNIPHASVAVNGPPPTALVPPPALPAPPGPPGPPPPGPTPTVRAGLCDPNRATAPLAELLIGDNGPNLICGFGGDDTLRGLNGADTLKGQQDNDVHAAGRGKDNARGGPGNDLLRGSRGADTLKGGGGRDTARGGKGTDLCRAEVEKGCET